MLILQPTWFKADIIDEVLEVSKRFFQADEGKLVYEELGCVYRRRVSSIQFLGLIKDSG